MDLRRTGILLLTGTVLAGCAAASTPPGASTSGMAGLVVLHADGSVRTACVAFEGTSITGEELLARSGMAVRLDSSNAMGSLVCSIDGGGCAHPAEPCLCACDTPGSCAYWSYFQRDRQAGWVYSAQGAHIRHVGPGEVDAWVWLLSSGPSDAQAVLERLRPFTFEAVCPAHLGR